MRFTGWKRLGFTAGVEAALTDVAGGAQGQFWHYFHHCQRDPPHVGLDSLSILSMSWGPWVFLQGQQANPSGHSIIPAFSTRSVHQQLAWQHMMLKQIGLIAIFPSLAIFRRNKDSEVWTNLQTEALFSA